MVNDEPFKVHGDQWCCAQCHALSDPDCHDRLTRYAQAVGLSDQTGWIDSQDALTVASVVMAVSDAEQAELRAEVERLRAEIDECWVPLYHGTKSERDSAEAKLAQAWDEGFEAASNWIGSNPPPSGVWSDPPRNPYALDGHA